ncbi:amino acid ABC transporter permease [Saccharopolyspora indica]|uniref:amino acid ABC transporter permease n=1 Tax=Saccharopolyspora indica TaxID=1229659 RepID=UPI0022EB984D|nr:amino acid ABC transporter permease [Saccharopolyspora indica]MDA3644446.1 amino acid ABC transporter permease [Saccharopolyspora indica]
MTEAPAVQEGRRSAEVSGPVVPLRRTGSRILAALVVVLLVCCAAVVVDSGQISWPAVGGYLFDPSILSGVGVTIALTFASMALSCVIGVVLALMRMSGSAVLSATSSGYIWFFRGTPLLVQIIFWFNIALFVPEISLGPVEINTNELVTPYVAAVLALSLHEAAYMAEIVRSGLQSVPLGQREAAGALGLTPAQTMAKVVLPQAMAVIIPPTGNQTIGMLKTTSLVSVVAASDLLTKAQHIYTSNYLVIELLIVASAWYLALTTVASLCQYFIERHFAPAERKPRRTRTSGEAGPS